MFDSFEEALLSGDLAAVRSWPKGDLHNHGFLSSDRNFLRERTGYDIAPVSESLKSMDEMHEWVGSNVKPCFERPDARLLGYEAAFALARRDGVTRIEFGDDIWQVTQNGTAGELLRSLQELHQAVASEIEWIPLIGMSRHCRIQRLEEWIEPFLTLAENYRVLDLYGDEMAQPIELFVPLYRKAQAVGLRLKAHVGEWGTADDVWRAVEELELDEVQHGIAAAESPAVMRFLAENGIRLNICPTSNILLGRVSRLEEHPIRKLFDAGITVTINTDDALVFGATVSEEFLSLLRVGLFAAAELEQIRQNSLTDTVLQERRLPVG